MTEEGPSTKEIERLRARVAALEQQLATRGPAAEPANLSIPLRLSPIPAVAWNHDFRIIDWNSAAENLFCYSREEAIGRSVSELIIPPEVRPHVDQVVADLLARCGGVYSVNDNLTRDGRRLTCQWFNTPLHDADGALMGIVSFAHDITQQKHTEQKLLASEDRWRSLVENAPELIMLTDIEGRIQFVNHYAEGYSEQTIIGTTLLDPTRHEHREIVRQAIHQVTTTGKPAHYEVQDELFRRWYATTLGPVFHGDQVVGLIVVCTDATDRKRVEAELKQSHDELAARVAERTQELDRLIAQLRSDIAVREQLERELRESEERFRAIATAVPAPMAISTLADGTILEVNQQLCVMLRMEKDEILTRKATDFYHDPAVRAPLLQKLRTEGGVSDYELQMVRSDGTPVWSLISMRRVMYEGKEAAVSTFLDITERHHAEQSLRHERRLLQRLLELQERDRQLIAYEIHDGFVQDVVGGKMLLEAVLARLQPPDDPRWRELEQALHFLTRSINEGRRMIGELRPMIIDEEGIVAAIMYLINSEQPHAAPEIRFVDNIQFDRLEPMLEGAIFRIVQEALGNALRHSQTEQIEVRLTQVDDELHIEIEDQGIGFDPAQVPEDRFGLRGIQERARLFGGSAVIQSRPGHGARIHVRMPILLSPE